MPTKVLNNKFFDDFNQIKRLNNLSKNIKSSESSTESWKESMSKSSKTVNHALNIPLKEILFKSTKVVSQPPKNIGRNSNNDK